MDPNFWTCSFEQVQNLHGHAAKTSPGGNFVTDPNRIRCIVNGASLLFSICSMQLFATCDEPSYVTSLTWFTFLSYI